MAITQTIVDDFDDSQPASTYPFALEDSEYEIDLSEHNLAKLRAALAPFIAAGRRRPKTTKTRRTRRSAPNRTTPERPDAAAVRAWWAENWSALGLPQPVSHLGSVPTRIQDTYAAAHPVDSPAARD